VNKNGKIILLDNDSTHDALCNGLKELGYTNDVICFDDAEKAGYYLRENQLDVFLLLQSSSSPAVQVPDTRNMIFMHESFKTDNIPYTFLVLTKEKLPTGRVHTFIHCYYKPAPIEEVAQTITQVIAFWKDHVFPPRVV
jgi:hypothetical protein